MMPPNTRKLEEGEHEHVDGVSHGPCHPGLSGALTCQSLNCWGGVSLRASSMLCCTALKPWPAPPAGRRRGMLMGMPSTAADASLPVAHCWLAPVDPYDSGQSGTRSQQEVRVPFPGGPQGSQPGWLWA